jgi:hypothetical protein
MDRRQSKILVVVDGFDRYLQENGLCRDTHRPYLVRSVRELFLEFALEYRATPSSRLWIYF